MKGPQNVQNNHDIYKTVPVTTNEVSEVKNQEEPSKARNLSEQRFSNRKLSRPEIDDLNYENQYDHGEQYNNYNQDEDIVSSAVQSNYFIS